MDQATAHYKYAAALYLYCTINLVIKSLTSAYCILKIIKKLYIS